MAHQSFIRRAEASPDANFDSVIERNIRALLKRQRDEEQRKSLEARIADAITRFTGSMRFVYAHLALYGAWAFINTGWLPIRRFDPTFVGLATMASVEAIFLSTFILISQNRQTEIADKRADLDLQVNLLAEHELTRLIQLVQEMARHMGIETTDPDLEAASNDVQPEQVIQQIEENQRRFRDEESVLQKG